MPTARLRCHGNEYYVPGILRAVAEILPKVGEGTERDVYIGGDTNVPALAPP